MSGEALISRIASACKPRSQCASRFQRGHRTSGSSLFETVYFRFSFIFEELDLTEPSPLPQIPKAFCLCPYVSSCVYLPSQGYPGLHQVDFVGTLQTCMQWDSHCDQVTLQKPARPRGCKVGTQLLPPKGSFLWLNFDADCKIIAQNQEVPTSLFERCYIVSQVLLEHLIHSLSIIVRMRVISSKELALCTPHLEQLNQKSTCELRISIAHYILKHPKMLHNVAEEDSCSFFS